MSLQKPAFTVGIEEEYLLVDRETRDLAQDPPPKMMDAFGEVLETQVSPEFLRSQVEIGTKVCANLSEAREELRRLRSGIAHVADEYGYAPIAASTHPFADWWRQKHTDKERYNVLADDLATVVRRLVTCGFHVHVGIEDDDLRLDLMSQATYFLPHLLALSTSSPFWGGANTGLKSYRLAVFQALPRTGLPPKFSGWSEYRRHVETLTEAGIIQDATKLWWDLRPSDRYPTLEMRITDLPTRMEDGLAIAAAFLSILHMLYRLRADNQKWRTYDNMLIAENKWRAQRYGIDQPLMDYGAGKLVPFSTLVEELIEILSGDAEALGCLPELEHTRVILERGTSADRQLAVHAAAKKEGADDVEALRSVVDFLITETVADI